MLVLAPFAGTIADRYSKRRVLIITQAFMGIVGAVLGLLTVTGVVQVWRSSCWHCCSASALLATHRRASPS